jgi:hypothetical protein
MHWSPLVMLLWDLLVRRWRRRQLRNYLLPDREKDHAVG